VWVIRIICFDLLGRIASQGENQMPSYESRSGKIRVKITVNGSPVGHFFRLSLGMVYLLWVRPSWSHGEQHTLSSAQRHLPKYVRCCPAHNRWRFDQNQLRHQPTKQRL